MRKFQPSDLRAAPLYGLLMTWLLVAPGRGQELPPQPAADQRSQPAEANLVGAPVRQAPQLRRKCAPTLGPPRPGFGVDSVNANPYGPTRWCQRELIPWSEYHQGEYIGPARPQHVDEYRVRVDDTINFVYRLTRERTQTAYKLAVGDEIQLELLRDADVNRLLTIQPDGTVLIPFVGRVMASDRTAEQLQRELTERFKEYYKRPIVVITPTRVNTRLEDLRAAVDRRAGNGGQSQTVIVTPDGTVQLPGLGSVCVQGLALAEIKREVDAQYDQLFGGIEVTPILLQRAPRFVYVVGEVNNPGRFTLDTPTTLLQSISLAGGWINGANLRRVVVLRRDADWRMKAVLLNIEGVLYGERAIPRDEIWLRDSDIVIVPKNAVRVIDDAIQLAMTDGLYSIFPFLANGVFFDLNRNLNNL